MSWEKLGLQNTASGFHHLQSCEIIGDYILMAGGSLSADLFVLDLCMCHTNHRHHPNCCFWHCYHQPAFLSFLTGHTALGWWSQIRLKELTSHRFGQVIITTLHLIPTSYLSSISISISTSTSIITVAGHGNTATNQQPTEQ